MSAAILDAIRTYIDAEGGASFTAAVGGRVYHLEAPENTTLPLAVYGIQGASVVFGMDGSDSEEYGFELSIYASAGNAGAKAALAIDEKARTRLDGAILSPTGYDRLTVRVSQPGVVAMDGESVVVSSLYRLQATRL